MNKSGRTWKREVKEEGGEEGGEGGGEKAWKTKMEEGTRKQIRRGRQKGKMA